MIPHCEAFTQQQGWSHFPGVLTSCKATSPFCIWRALQVPQEVCLPEPVVEVAAGHHHTLFLTQSGNVWACGRNSRGQLGLGSKAGSHVCTPQPLNALAGLS